HCVLCYFFTAASYYARFRSKKNSHHQIEMPCAVPAVGKRIRRQVSILSGKQQVRSGAVNHVHKAPLISGQRRIPVGLRILEVFQIAGIRIVHSKRGIELPFFRGPVFQLRPATNRVQRLHFRTGQRRIAAEQHAATNAAVQSAKGPSAIKLSAQRKLAIERQLDICHSGSTHNPGGCSTLPRPPATVVRKHYASTRSVCRMPVGAMLPQAPPAGNNRCPALRPLLRPELCPVLPRSPDRESLPGISGLTVPPAPLYVHSY